MELSTEVIFGGLATLGGGGGAWAAVKGGLAWWDRQITSRDEQIKAKDAEIKALTDARATDGAAHAKEVRELAQVTTSKVEIAYDRIGALSEKQYQALDGVCDRLAAVEKELAELRSSVAKGGGA